MIDKSSSSSSSTTKVEARKPAASPSTSTSSSKDGGTATATKSTSETKSKGPETASEASDSKAKKSSAATEAAPVAESKSTTATVSVPRKLGDDFKVSPELQEDRDGSRKAGNRSVFVNRLRNALFGEGGEASEAKKDQGVQTPEQEAAQKLGADAARLKDLKANASSTSDPDSGGAAVAISAPSESSPVTSAAARRIDGPQAREAFISTSGDKEQLGKTETQDSVSVSSKGRSRKSAALRGTEPNAEGGRAEGAGSAAAAEAKAKSGEASEVKAEGKPEAPAGAKPSAAETARANGVATPDKTVSASTVEEAKASDIAATKPEARPNGVAAAKEVEAGDIKANGAAARDFKTNGVAAPEAKGTSDSIAAKGIDTGSQSDTSAAKGIRFQGPSGTVGVRRPRKASKAESAPEAADAQESKPTEEKPREPIRFKDSTGTIGVRRPRKAAEAQPSEKSDSLDKTQAVGKTEAPGKSEEGKAVRFKDASGTIGVRRPRKAGKAEDTSLVAATGAQPQAKASEETFDKPVRFKDSAGTIGVRRPGKTAAAQTGTDEAKASEPKATASKKESKVADAKAAGPASQAQVAREGIWDQVTHAVNSALEAGRKEDKAQAAPAAAARKQTPASEPQSETATAAPQASAPAPKSAAKAKAAATASTEADEKVGQNRSAEEAAQDRAAKAAPTVQAASPSTQAASAIAPASAAKPAAQPQAAAAPKAETAASQATSKATPAKAEAPKAESPKATSKTETHKAAPARAAHTSEKPKARAKEEPKTESKSAAKENPKLAAMDRQDAQAAKSEAADKTSQAAPKRSWLDMAVGAFGKAIEDTAKNVSHAVASKVGETVSDIKNGPSAVPDSKTNYKDDFAGFDQTKQSNCASVAVMKSAMEVYGNKVFDHVSRDGNGTYSITMQDGFKTKVTSAELNEAEKSGQFGGDNAKDKLYAGLMYAGMAKRAASEKYEGNGTFAGALKTFADGENPYDAARFLGLGDRVQKLDPSKLEGKDGVVAWNSQHAVYVDTSKGETKVDHYGKAVDYTGTDTKGGKLSYAFTFAARGQKVNESQGADSLSHAALTVKPGDASNIPERTSKPGDTASARTSSSTTSTVHTVAYQTQGDSPRAASETTSKASAPASTVASDKASAPAASDKLAAAPTADKPAASTPAPSASAGGGSSSSGGSSSGASASGPATTSGASAASGGSSSGASASGPATTGGASAASGSSPVASGTSSSGGSTASSGLTSSTANSGLTSSSASSSYSTSAAPYSSSASSYSSSSNWSSQNQQGQIWNNAMDQIQGQLNSPNSAFQDLQQINSLLNQTPGLQNVVDDLNRLSGTLGNLQGLPQLSQGLQGLADLAPTLGGLPDAMRSSQTVTSLLQRAQGLPAGARLTDYPDVQAAIADLPKAVADLQKLPDMTKLAQELPQHMETLNKLPDIVRGTEELNQERGTLGELPAKLKATEVLNNAGVATSTRPADLQPADLKSVNLRAITDTKLAGDVKQVIAESAPETHSPGPAPASRVVPAEQTSPTEAARVSAPARSVQTGQPAQALEAAHALEAPHAAATLPSARGPEAAMHATETAHAEPPHSVEAPRAAAPTTPKAETPHAEAAEPHNLESSAAQLEKLASPKNLQSLPAVARDLQRFQGLQEEATHAVAPLVELAKQPGAGITDSLKTLQDWARAPVSTDHPFQQGMENLRQSTSDPAVHSNLKQLESVITPWIGKQSTADGIGQLSGTIKPILDNPKPLQDLHDSAQQAPAMKSAGAALQSVVLDPRATAQIDRLHSALSPLQEGGRAVGAQIRRSSPEEQAASAARGIEAAHGGKEVDIFANVAKEVEQARSETRGEGLSNTITAPAPRPAGGLGLSALRLGGLSRPNAAAAPSTSAATPARAVPTVAAAASAPAEAAPTRPAVPAAPKPPVAQSTAPAGETGGSQATVHAVPEAPATGARAERKAATGETPSAGAGAAAGAAATQASAPQAVAAPKPQTQAAREVMSKGRGEAYKQTSNTVRDILAGKGNSDHPWSLVFHSRSEEGAKGLADTLETTVVRGGSQKMQQLFGEMGKSQDATVAFSAVLANVSHHASERAVGMLLLTTDGAGGKESVARMFSQMSKNDDSSIRLASFFENSTKSPLAAKGMHELFTNMTTPGGDLDWEGAKELSKTFARTSQTVGGARSMGNMLQNLQELEGGGQDFAKMLNRMSRTPEGASATVETLRNISFDKEGTNQVGKLLANASQSRDGGRNVLDALSRMTTTESGKRNVGQLLATLSDSPQGAKMLANLAKDPNNEGQLTDLFHQLNSSSQASALLGHAVSTMANDPRSRASWQALAGRVEVSAGLGKELEKALGKAGSVIPDAATQPAANTSMPLLESGKTAMAENQRTDGAEQAAALAASANLTQAAPVLRARPKFSDEEIKAIGESDDDREVRKRNIQYLSESLRAERPRRSEEAGQTRSHQQETPKNDGSSAFRPGDYYSDETLKNAKVCADCGYRTTSLGFCPRCAMNKKG